MLPAPGAPIPDGDHVLRYIRKKHVDNGVVNGSGFLTRPQEEMASVNWIECFAPPLKNQVAEISARRRLKYEKRALLVRLNVGHTKQYVVERALIPIQLSFLHAPLQAEDGKPADPSHALIDGVPTLDTAEGEAIKDLFTHCILERFPVVPDK